MGPDEKQYLTIDELSMRSGLSVSTLRRRVREGNIEALQPGGPGTRLLFRPDVLERSTTAAVRGIPRQGPVAPAGAGHLPGRRPAWMTDPVDSSNFKT